jgi:hypothetical protein
MVVDEIFKYLREPTTNPFFLSLCGPDVMTIPQYNSENNHGANERNERRQATTDLCVVVMSAFLNDTAKDTNNCALTGYSRKLQPAGSS